MTNWRAEIERLAYITKSQPQAAYSALVHGLQGKWTYLLNKNCPIYYSRSGAVRIYVIRTKLILVLTDQNQPGDIIRRLLSLSCRSGGLDLCDPTLLCTEMMHLERPQLLLLQQSYNNAEI